MIAIRSAREGRAFAELTLAQALLPLGQCNEQAQLLRSAVGHYDELLQSVAILPHLRQNRAIAIAHVGLLHHLARQNHDARELVDDAVADLNPELDEVVITNTIPLSDGAKACRGAAFGRSPGRATA